MKKFIVSLLLGVGIAANAALSTTVVVQPNTYTNLLSLNSGSAIVTFASVTANTTNASVIFVDAPTNTLFYTNAAYIGVTSYATNYIQSWTNYYGVVNYWTNMTLLDVTNTVAASTNFYNRPITASALASTTTTLNPLAANFEYGIWVTNNSSGIATVTIQYRQ